MPISNKQYQQRLWWLLGITIIVKIILANLLELGNDEVYYYTYALQPDWNHFDHPPMVGWMIRLTTLNLYWLSDLSMRLGSIVSAAVATILIFETGTIIKNEKAGFIAALLYNLSIYTSIIAGLFVLPDSPQLLFFSASIYLMTKWVVKPNLFKFLDWVLLGCCIGFATLSKVHGLFLWAGFGAFLIFNQAKTFKQPALYLAGLISLMCLIPIVYWNIQNEFITYTFHSKRVAHTSIHLDTFLQQIVGEFLYQNPLVYIASIIALFNIKQLKKMVQQDEVISLLLWLSIPLILTFWVLSLFNPTLPHWTGPGFIALFILAGIYWSEKSTKFIPSMIQWAIGFLGALVLAFLCLVYIYPQQLGSNKKDNLGEYNPINDVTGWKQFKEAFEGLVQKDIQSGKMRFDAPIVTHKWFPGGHILFYVSTPLHKALIGIGNLEDLHKFAWLNKDIKGIQLGQSAYVIEPSNLPSNTTEMYSPYFNKIELAAIVPITIRGVELRYFKVYRLLDCKKLPDPVLSFTQK
jgi:4-amino-4-deoxy-L-arabinose transferase-like glycosyltransferase